MMDSGTGSRAYISAAKGCDADGGLMAELGTKQNKKKLLLVSPMLHQGGFERICVATARLLSPYFDVTTAIFDDADIAYDVTGLSIVNLNLPVKQGKIGKAVNLLRRIRALKALKKHLGTDVTYSFGQTANLVNCNARANDKVICGLRSYQDFDNPEKIRMFCRKADLIACCSREMEKQIREDYGCDRTFTLYNPVRIPEDAAGSGSGMQAASAGNSKPGDTSIGLETPLWDDKEGLTQFLSKHGQLVMSMGREDDVKGFWHLIKAFSIVSGALTGKDSGKDAAERAPGKASGEGTEAERTPGLIIMGDGTFDEYRKLAQELGIGEHVFFTGVMKKPFPLLKKASAYALTSSMEGFPNALVEAMALGVPAIASDCMTGPAEIIHTKDGNAGVLLPVFSDHKDLDAGSISEEDVRLADEILKILRNPALASEISSKGKIRAADFSEEAYINNCLEFFKS